MALDPVRRDPTLRWSFLYLDTTHPSFDARRKDAAYFRLLLARLRELSAFRAEELVSSRSRALRIHPIDWSDAR
ncbi:MAG TPA: hypothetical protein VF771_09575, partial [Longimicrobiaceae bacterium]